MAKASDNPFPSILIVETAAPSSPSSGNQRLFIDPTDHVLKYKNSAGTVTAVSSGGGSSGAAHGARVKRSANQSIGNNTLTAVAFTAEDYDTDTIHDNSTNNSRLTIPTISGVTTGLWAVKASGYVDQPTGDFQFMLNTSTPIGFARNGNPGDIGGVVLAVDWVFTAADYVELFARTPGGAGNILYDVGKSPLFSIAFLGKVT